MTHTLLFILVVVIGFLYSRKYGEKAKKEIKEFSGELKTELDADEIYMHEDFYLQVELIPLENSEYLEKENEAVIDFSKEHSDGYGFADIYVRNEVKTKTTKRNIKVEDFEELVTNIGFIKKRNVYTGYSTYRVKCDNTNAYSIDGAAIYCDYKNGVIENIWIDNFRFNQESQYINEMVECLYKVGNQWDLTLNDWDLAEKVNLMDKSAIRIYITEK